MPQRALALARVLHRGTRTAMQRPSQHGYCAAPRKSIKVEYLFVRKQMAESKAGSKPRTDSRRVFDLENLLYPAIANSIHLTVQMNSPVVIVHSDLNLLPDLRHLPLVQDLYRCMLGVKRFQFQSVKARNARQTPLTADRLNAGVDDKSVIASSTDDRCQNCKCGMEVWSEGCIPGIHQQVRAGLRLCHSRKVRHNDAVTCAAAADNLHRNAVALDQLFSRDQLRQGFLHDTFFFWT